MSKNVIIRDLSEDQQLKLEALRLQFDEKTNSKVIERLIHNFGNLQIEIKKLKQETYNLKEEKSKLLSFFRRVESEVDDYNSTEEDPEEMY